MKVSNHASCRTGEVGTQHQQLCEVGTQHQQLREVGTEHQQLRDPPKTETTGPTGGTCSPPKRVRRTRASRHCLALLCSPLHHTSMPCYCVRIARPVSQTAQLHPFLWALLAAHCMSHFLNCGRAKAGPSSKKHSAAPQLGIGRLGCAWISRARRLDPPVRCGAKKAPAAEAGWRGDAVIAFISTVMQRALAE